MFKEHRNTIFSYLTIIIISFLPLLCYKQLDLFKKINKINSPTLDVFFSYISILGNGYTYLIFLTSLLFLRKIEWVFGGFLSLLIILIVVKSMKLIFFKNAMRPHNFIYEGMHIVDNLNLTKYGSFPSGHASVIFSMATLCLFIFKRNVFFSLALYFIAFLVSYSRVYLSYHFYKDIFVGMLIGGLVTTYICYRLSYFIDLTWITLIKMLSKIVQKLCQ